MLTELQHFNSLSSEDRDIIRKHFLSIGANSYWYSSLEEAIRGSVDWEKIPQDSAEWFYFSDLLEDAKKVGNIS